MPITVTRARQFLNDADGDNVADPGDTFFHTITVINGEATAAINLFITESENGIAIDAGSFNIGPIAIDDNFNTLFGTVQGNTPIDFTATQLLTNDLDPDDISPNLTITRISGVAVVDGNGDPIAVNDIPVTNGTVTSHLDGSFTFTPTTGFEGAASFTYDTVDEDGVPSVAATPALVSITVSDCVWYIDSTGGSDTVGVGDGSYDNPFASLAPLTSGGTSDGLDDNGDTLFVYANGANAYNSGIVLEDGQVLRGEGTGTSFVVNGITVSDGSAGDTQIEYTTFGAQLGSGNTITGIDFVGEAGGAVAIQDGGGTAGSLNISNTEVSGQGQIIDVDQGGTLNVTFESVASSGSNGSGTGSGAIDLNAVQGTFTVTGATNLTGGSHTGGGIDITSSSSALTASFQGALVVNSGTGTAINFSDNAASSALNLTGGTTKDIDTTSGDAIKITNNATSITTISNGALDIDTGSGDGFEISQANGQVNVSVAADIDAASSGRGINIGSSTGGAVNFTGGNLTITTNSGTALHANNAVTGSSLTISGSGNTLQTVTTGALVDISNVGSSGITIDTLSAANVPTTAILINNLDGGTWTSNSIVVNTTTGANSDGIRIQGGSSMAFNFGNVQASNTSDDGIELNGANGAVDFDSLTSQNTGGQNLEIVNATSLVNVDTGSLGTVDDAVQEAVLISGGTGAVTIGALITKTTAGNVVEITGHNTGTIDFNNNISATGAANNGVLINANTGGIIRFDGGLTLTTGGNIAFSATSNGSVQLAIVDPGGANSGHDNNLTTTTGTALNVTSTTIHSDGLNFESISSNGAVSGIILNATGAGALTVTGNGSANSGGTINASTGVGISLTDTGPVSLTRMLIQNGGDDGIRGNDVGGFTLNNSSVLANGNVAGERGIEIIDLGGSGGMSGTTVTGSADSNIRIENNNVTLTAFNVTGSTIGTNNMSIGNDGMQVILNGSGSMTASVTGSTFTDNKGDHFQASTDADATGQMNITFNNNTLNTTALNDPNVLGGGVTINTSGSADIVFQINNNNIQQAFDDAININLDPGSLAGASMNGTISGNTIGTAGVDDSGSESSRGITVASKGQGNTTISITNNIINEWGNEYGITVETSDGSSNVNAVVSGNTVKNGGTFALNAIHIMAGAAAADNGLLEVTLTNNNVDGSMPGVVGAGQDIRLRQRFLTTIKLPGYLGGNGDNTAVNNFVIANNTPGADPTVSSVDNTAGGGGGFIGGADLMLAEPPAPPAPEPVTPDEDQPVDTGGGPDTPPADDGGDADPPPADDGGDTDAPPAPPAPTPEPHPVIVDDNVLTQAELDYLVEAAIERWAEAGATPEQLAAMRAAKFSIADMAGVYLGTSEPGKVLIDSDGAGHGWFLDTTPGDDGEFDPAGGVLKADAGGAASGKMDLLTVLMHELGHQVGLDDLYNSGDADELMYGYARLAERRLPQADDLAGADMSHAGHESFIESSPTVASLPAGKGVIFTYTSTVLGNPNGFIGGPFNNTSTVETDNFANVVSANEQLVTDGLTLGDTVYIDANTNNQFDSGEGVQGVTVTLYADTDSSGGFSAGDVAVAGGTDITDVNGNYSFVGLDEGNYIVVVDAANFGSGGALENHLTAPGNADPDDNEDNDDNGVNGLGGVIASATIRLDFNEELVAGLGNDTNNTLDFGFLDPNDAPVITSPATASGNEDTAISVTGISVADVDAGTADVLVTLSIANGALDLGTTTGLTVVGEGTGLVTLEGALSDLNTALATLTYTPVADFNGSPVNLSITANDQGATGPDPGLTGDANSEEDTATVAITVNAVADIAGDTINTINEDDPATALDLLANDSFENSGRAITGVSDPTNGTAVIDDNGTPGDLTDDFVVYTPDANFNGADSFTYTVTSGGVTEQATVNLNIGAVNDAPAGTTDTITAIEDTFRPLSGTDFGFTDVDVGDVLSEVIITGVTGVTLYIDTGADGFDDPGDAVSTFPATVTAAQLAANQVAIKAAPNASGAGLGTITFQVVDDSGAANDTDLSANTLTVDVTAVNDAPTLDVTGPLNYDEGDPATAILSAATLGDVDSLNFGGGSLTVSFTANGTTADQLDVLTAGGISRSGNDILFGATDIGDVSGGTNGTNLVITFDSDATLARVEALIEAIGYSNNSDDPSELARTVNFLVDDGDGGTSTASDTATVNVNAINDGPVNVPGGVVNVNEDSGATTLSGMSIDDPDSAGDDIIVGFSVSNGTLGINTGVGGGITAGDIQFQDATTIVVVATRAQINATLADPVGLTYTPNANFNGTDTLEIATNDNGENGDDPGLTGDANNEQDLDTRDINVAAANDPVTSTVTSPINVNEDTAGALTLSIADIDAALNPSGVYEVTLTATNGTTTLTTLTGLTFSAGNGSDDAVMTFRGTLANINSALATASFKGDSNFNGAASVKIDVTDDVLGTVATGTGAGTSDSDTISITVDPLDDNPTATNDAYTTNEATDITGQNLLANEADPDGGAAPTISQVNGMNVVGSEITLASGAKLTVNSDGTFTYKPNDAFDELAEFGSGASNTLDSDSFTYTLTTGGTATVNLTIQGDYSDPHLMLGTAGDDTITGTFFDDIFSPGTGADTMTGHQGDDIYEVDQLGDQTIEAFGQGNDEVRSTINWTLHKHLEDLTLLGSATHGTGNQLANTIVGNAGNNVLDGLGGADEMRGGAGDDQYRVQNGADQAVETSLADGTDTVISSAHSFTLGAFVENLFLVGGAVKGEGNGLANLIIGNAGGNVLDGKGGADEMRGGGGDDLYMVDNAGDVVVELNGGGTDTVRASVSYQIFGPVNHLELIGSALDGTGNSNGNRITGNGLGNFLKGVDGNDILTGGGGDDLLSGGKGNDRLQGDAGADRYYFSTALNAATNVDDILDFSTADDSIYLSRKVFDQIGLGPLSAAAFHTGAAAADASDRIIYDSATGNLFYDEDGTGAAAQVLFATLDPGLAMNNADFIVY